MKVLCTTRAALKASIRNDQKPWAWLTSPGVVHKAQSPLRSAKRNDPVEARAPASVAASAVAAHAHLQPDRVLVAVDPHFNDSLDLSACVAFMPQLAARAGPVPGFAGFDGPRQGVGVHVRDHQDLAGVGVGGHACDQAIGPEPWRQDEALFHVGFGAGTGERRVFGAHSINLLFSGRPPSLRRLAGTQLGSYIAPWTRQRPSRC